MALQKFSWLSMVIIFLAGCRSEAAPIPPDGMVLLPANGKNNPALFVDETEVSYAQFAAFVDATGYVTEAEEYGWSGVFALDSLAWLPIDSASWKYPEGPAQAAAGPNEPVVHISFKDATAYAKWSGKRLPTEEEWIRAASNNGKYLLFPWGETETPNGEYLGNWWQGPFPQHDEVLDGFNGRANIKSFPPTELGIYEIGGNVWEWTTTLSNGQYVIRGGSFLCSNSYCSGFKLNQKQYTPEDSGLNHLGFRCVKDL